MKRIVFLLLSSAVAAIVPGCGGGEGSSTRDVTIRDFGFVPTVRTVKVGATVRWVNADSVTHTVVSGVLLPTPSPINFKVAILNTSFSPATLAINFGDTITFTNLDTVPHQIEVKDRDLNVLFLSSALNRNETAIFASDRTGVLEVRDVLNQTLRMQITVAGDPVPDHRFSSDALPPGRTFRFTFTKAGVFDYFCGVHHIESGTVRVEQ